MAKKFAGENLVMNICSGVLKVDSDELTESVWEYQLELMGTDVSVDILRKHLALAPNPKSEDAVFLAGYLSSLPA